MNDRIQSYNLLLKQQREQQTHQPQVIQYITNNYYVSAPTLPQPPMQYGDRDPNSCPVMFVDKERN